MLRWITLRKLDNYQKIGKKRWKRKTKRRGGKIEERRIGLDQNFVAQFFFSFFLICFGIGLCIVLDESYSNSYEHGLYIYKSGLNRLSIVQ
jgi:hypothetical protein